MTEREKMINGALYDPSDPELEQLRLNARKLPATKQFPYLQAPVYFDYGCNTY